MRNAPCTRPTRFARWLSPLTLVLVVVGCDQKPAPAEAPTPDKVVATVETKTDTPAPEAPTPSAEPTASAEAPAAPSVTGAVVAKTDPAAKPDGKPAEVKPAASVESEPKKGADASAVSFTAWLQSSGAYGAGKQGTVTAVLVAKDPYKCNDKYPYKFKLDAPSAGVSYPQDVVRGMQVTPKRSTLTIPFVPSQAGPATVAGTLFFSVCTDERCLIEQTKLSVTVDVK
jgi:hypothetical protein